MKRTWCSVAAVVVIAVSMVSSLSCARDQELVSIALQPAAGFVFEGFDAQGQFTALGTYIHPPETKDITNKVVWTIDIANFGTITPAGQITYTRTDGCGSGNVTATFYTNASNPTAGSVVTASAPVKGSKDGTATCQ